MSIVAGDVMTREVRTVTGETPIRSLIESLRATRFSGFPVVDASGRAVGLISQNDVLRALAFLVSGGGDYQDGKRKAALQLLAAKGDAGFAGLLDRPVKELMTPTVTSCRVDTPLERVCAVMEEQRIHRVVVTDAEGKVVGLIAALDVVRRFGAELRGGAGHEA
jgi:CBS domain-containing protein